jgi:hypothetical protein
VFSLVSFTCLHFCSVCEEVEKTEGSAQLFSLLHTKAQECPQFASDFIAFDTFGALADSNMRHFFCLVFRHPTGSVILAGQHDEHSQEASIQARVIVGEGPSGAHQPIRVCQKGTTLRATCEHGRRTYASHILAVNTGICISYECLLAIGEEGAGRG